MEVRPGLIALFGSGEISASGRRVYDWLFRRLPQPLRVAVLETPAGFQPNSAAVAGEVADFVRDRLPEFKPSVTVVPARRKGGEHSTDDASILEPILAAEAISLGPGSPTYAVNHLRDSLALHYVCAGQRLGSALILASAATIAASRHTLPVYEIYKVGSDLHWQDGLDLLGAYGLHLTFVPHWNNAEGGAELDTSRCFMGKERFERLRALLPGETTIVGIDEHTALIVDLAGGDCRVMGLGTVSVMRGGEEARHAPGSAFALDTLGDYDPYPAGILPDAVMAARENQLPVPAPPQPGAEVLRLVEEREEARARRDWQMADAIRRRLGELGWKVDDAPAGPNLQPLARDA